MYFLPLSYLESDSPGHLIIVTPPRSSTTASYFYLVLPNADVLPPGQGRVVGVDVVEFMPVGSDNLLGIGGRLID